MKSAPKILNAIFILFFIFQLIGLLVVMILPTATQAEVIFRPEVTIGDIKAGSAIPVNSNTLGKYIRSVYQYAIGFVGILAAVVMMYGGLKWLTAGGNPSAVGDAQEWITAALTGLVITMTSYLILATVNPALVNLQMREVKDIAAVPVGCCTYQDNGTPQNIKTTQAECQDKGGTYTTAACPVSPTFTCTGQSIPSINPNDPAVRSQCPIQCASQGGVSGSSQFYDNGRYYCCMCQSPTNCLTTGGSCSVGSQCCSRICNTSGAALGGMGYCQ